MIIYCSIIYHYRFSDITTYFEKNSIVIESKTLISEQGEQEYFKNEALCETWKYGKEEHMYITHIDIFITRKTQNYGSS